MDRADGHDHESVVNVKRQQPSNSGGVVTMKKISIMEERGVG